MCLVRFDFLVHAAAPLSGCLPNYKMKHKNLHYSAYTAALKSLGTPSQPSGCLLTGPSLWHPARRTLAFPGLSGLDLNKL